MTKEVSQREKPKVIQVLSRAMTIMDFIARHPIPPALHEISDGTGIHPSTAHRMLWNLAEEGFLERNDDGCWRLGLRFLEYGNLVQERLDIRVRALPIMHRLHEQTGQTVNLSLRHADNVMYIEHVYAPEHGVRLARRIGAMAPLHTTSGGKLFLCQCSPQEVSEYIHRTGLAKRTQYSIDTPEKMIMELNKIKELGWSEDNEELEIGIRCVGSAVFDSTSQMVAAITLVSSTDMQQKPEWVKHVQHAADQLSAELGYKP